MWKSSAATKRGFTLIEILIVTSIVAILATAVFSTLSGGLKIFEKVKAYTGTQIDILISLEKLAKDLRSVFCISGIDFIGDAKSISFAGLMKVSDEEGDQETSVGKLSYYFDEEEKTLIREEQSYPEVKSEGKESGNLRVLAYVEDINFKYYCFKEDTEEYIWQDSWAAGSGIPKCIRIEITFNDGNRDVTLAKTVFLPISG